jgi:uncharacterized protein (DUF885 family)
VASKDGVREALTLELGALSGGRGQGCSIQKRATAQPSDDVERRQGQCPPLVGIVSRVTNHHLESPAKNGRLHSFGEEVLGGICRLDPVLASEMGIRGFEAEMTDYSPEGIEARARLFRDALSQLVAVPICSHSDEVTARFIAQHLRSRIGLADAGEDYRELRNMFGPAQGPAECFDSMARDSVADWDNIAARLELVPGALEGMKATLEVGRRRGLVAARRQALAVADQALIWAGDSGATSRFASLTVDYRSRADAADSLASRLEKGADAAARAYGEFGRYLRNEYCEDALEADAVGPERYRAWAAYTVGADVDPEASYEWAWAEFARLAADRDATGAKVLPDADLAGVLRYLNQESSLALDNPNAYIRWHQEQLDRAMEALSGTHFDIPDGLRFCEAVIPPTGGAAAPYYTAPTVDGSVAGRICFPIAGRSRFPLWSEQTTSFHEGVPGHHLQVGLITLYGDDINPLRRFLFSSAYSEGWALYAERLCDELGWFDRPEFRLGFICAQLLRAARVIVDIGLHLDLPIPSGQPFHSGERWTPELAGTFLAQETGFDKAFISSEIVRYLGWPSQAIGYKLGERAWLEGRDRARRNNPGFGLQAFHTAALAAGPLGLDQLADELATM